MVNVSRGFSFQKLNENNYQTWKYRMELLLTREDSWNVDVEPALDPITAAWKLKRGKARTPIALLVEDGRLIHIRRKETAKQT